MTSLTENALKPDGFVSIYCGDGRMAQCFGDLNANDRRPMFES